MIILLQDEESVFTLEDKFVIETCPEFDAIPELNAIQEIDPKGWYVRLEQENTIETLGHFKSLDKAKLTIKDFTYAYERGDRVFRVPFDS